MTILLMISQLTNRYGRRRKYSDLSSGLLAAVCFLGSCCICPAEQPLECIQYYGRHEDRHNRGVETHRVSMSPNGFQVAVLDGKGYVKVWRADTGECFGELRNSGEIASMSYRPNGNELITGMDDGSIFCWETLTLGRIGIWETQGSRVTAIDISADGKTAVTGGLDGTVAVRDAHMGVIQQRLEHSVASIEDVAVSADGRIVISGSKDRISVWNAQTGQLLHTLEHANGSTGAVSVDIQPEGQLMIAGEEEGGTVTVWDLSTGTSQVSFDCENADVRCVRFSPDGQSVVTACNDGTIRLWDATNGTLISQRLGHTEGALSWTQSSSGDLAASTGSGGEVIIWKGDRQVGILRTVLGAIAGVSFEASGEAWRAFNDNLGLWRWPVGKGPIESLSDDSRLYSKLQVMSADGSCILRSDHHSVEIERKDATDMITWDIPGDDFIGSIAISRDGKRCFLGGNYFLFVLDAQTGRLEGSLPIASKHTWKIAVSPDGQLAAVGGGTGDVECFDLQQMRSLWRRKAQLLQPNGRTNNARSVNSLAFARNQHLVLSVDDTVQVWDTASGTPLQEHPSNHNQKIRHIIALKEGVVAAAGVETTVWNKRTIKSSVIRVASLSQDGRKMKAIASGNAGPLAIESLEASADGSRLLSADSGNWIRIWGIKQKQ